LSLRIIVAYVLGVFVAVFPGQTLFAGDTATDPDKLRIVELIEDELASAYTKRSAMETPDFGTLDRIFPAWHGGDPAHARRKLDNCRYYVVSYTVSSVVLPGPDAASVTGEKTVELSRKTTLLKWIPRDQTRKTRYRFTMECRRREDGGWYIAEELLE
jgi:hypothetical protein